MGSLFSETYSLCFVAALGRKHQPQSDLRVENERPWDAVRGFGNVLVLTSYITPAGASTRTIGRPGEYLLTCSSLGTSGYDFGFYVAAKQK
jgi:hypothetical protein